MNAHQPATSDTQLKRPREIYKSHDVFRRIASRTAHGVGHPLTFVAAVATILLWATTGPFFHYSDTWQLVINTSTTIITFLMVFLIQNTQNRDSHAIHLKLDELIHASKHARNRLIALEELSERELDDLQDEFDRIAREKVQESRARDSSSTASLGPPSSRARKLRDED